MKKRSLGAFAAIGLLAASLTGCSASASAGGLDEIVVGVLPSVESAPLFLGVEEGIFEDAGISLRITSFASSGAAMVEPVVNGDYDVAIADMVTLFKADNEGTPVRLIAPAGSAGAGDRDFGGVVVKEDSPIQELGDLEGRFVGTNSLLDTNNVVLRALMDQGAMFSYTVQWNEVPFQGAAKALDDGTADAVFLVEPYLTAAINDGNRLLSYGYQEFDPDLDVNAYFTSVDFIEKNPDLYERFTAALKKSIESAAESEPKVRAVLNTYSKSEWYTRAFFSLPTYKTEFDREPLDRLGDAAVKYLIIKDSPDLDALLG